MERPKIEKDLVCCCRELRFWRKHLVWNCAVSDPSSAAWAKALLSAELPFLHLSNVVSFFPVSGQRASDFPLCLRDHFPWLQGWFHNLRVAISNFNHSVHISKR